MAKRKAVGFLISEKGMSERRACRIVGLARSVQQYRPMPKDDASALGYLTSTEFLMKTTAPALETLAVSTLPLNTQTQTEDSRYNRP